MRRSPGEMPLPVGGSQGGWCQAAKRKQDERAKALRETYGVRTVSNSEAAKAADTLVLAVKPQDMATLLAHAMRRPLDGDAHRPRLVRLRGHRQ